MAKWIQEAQEKYKMRQQIFDELKDVKFFWLGKFSVSRNLNKILLSEVAEQAGYAKAIFESRVFYFLPKAAREAMEYVNDEH